MQFPLILISENSPKILSSLFLNSGATSNPSLLILPLYSFFKGLLSLVNPVVESPIWHSFGAVVHATLSQIIYNFLSSFSFSFASSSTGNLFVLSAATSHPCQNLAPVHVNTPPTDAIPIMSVALLVKAMLLFKKLRVLSIISGVSHFAWSSGLSTLTLVWKYTGFTSSIGIDLSFK